MKKIIAQTIIGGGIFFYFRSYILCIHEVFHNRIIVGAGCHGQDVLRVQSLHKLFSGRYGVQTQVQLLSGIGNQHVH